MNSVKSYSEIAGSYDQTRFQATNGKFLYQTDKRIVCELFSQTASDTLLDAPVGTGRVLDYLRHDRCKIVGIDYTDEMLQISRQVATTTGDSVIKHILATSGARGSSKGGNLGRVRFEMLPPEERTIDVTSQQMVREWRRMIGAIPGAEQLSFRASFGRSGEPIEVQLRSNSLEDMHIVADNIKEHLKTYPGLFDIQDNLSGGKDEFQLKLKPEAYNLGISLRDIGVQTRQAIFGLETQRIQRGRDEIRVMLRSPKENRSSLQSLYTLPIQLSNGETIALSEVATIESGSSPSALYRINRFRTLSVTSDADTKRVDLEAVKRSLKTELETMLTQYPGVQYEMEGEAKEQKETFGSAGMGGILVLLAIHALLAIPFKSYGQPLIVMSIIPIGLVGAILGHIITFNNLSIMSVFGMLALSGVVINDSLVLVDYINKQRQRGHELIDAVLTAGAQRFRPVMLTSLTTFAGLTPLLLETSTQAQFLKPMAISLGFGIIFATLITLLVVPVNYLIYEATKKAIRPFFLKRVSADIN